ncbi:MAG: VCBS repeat-containing protein [Vicinamibacterales bacterium]
MIKRALLILGLLSWTSSAFAQRDQVDISTAVVWNSPADVASWSKTTSITAMTMRPSNDNEPGLAFAFPANATWPDYTPPGWDGPIQYTVWAGVNINGVWHISGIIQMWRDRAATGAPLLTDFARNWVYDSRWGAMQGYQPHVGERMIFFVTAGNARGDRTVTSVRERSNVVAVNLPAGDYGNFSFSSSTSNTVTPGDVDGDGKTDVGIYRPSTSQLWVLKSSGNYSTYNTVGWGIAGDIPEPGDYDGDGRLDAAVYRPSTAQWWILWSSTNFTTYKVYGWGVGGDVPVPADYDGDGRTDIAVYRPTTGGWWVLKSSTGFANYSTFGWGLVGDVPVLGDYDGDGKSDPAIFRPSTAHWWILKSSSNYTAYSQYGWGVGGDVPVAADYDGDGATDVAVYRPTTGGWWVLRSNSGFAAYSAFAWGLVGDVPVLGDYDGDGRTDVAVYRPSNGTWWILNSNSGFTQYSAYQWGQPGDVPVLQRK